jgi:cobaltochelatase CobT
MGSMAVHLENGGSVGGCNVDHEVIWRGASRLLKRGKKRKIQFVLSDGHPSGCGGTYGGFLEEELIKVNEKIKSLGIEQVAIGIQDDNVEKFYPKTLVLHELDKLDQEALTLIAELFLSRL